MLHNMSCMRERLLKDASLEPRLSVLDFVSQLFSKAVRQNLEQKAWVQGYKDATFSIMDKGTPPDCSYSKQSSSSQSVMHPGVAGMKSGMQ